MGTSSKISDFEKKCKLYFSSLTARQCKYAYLNVPGYSDKLVITNGEAELLTGYPSSLLSMHILTPKDGFLDTLKKYLKLDEQPDKSKIIGVRVSVLCRACKDVPIEACEVVVDKDTGVITIKSGEKFIVADKRDTASEDEADETEDDEEEEETKPTLAPNASDDEKASYYAEKLLEDDGWDTCVKKVLFTSNTECAKPLNIVYAANMLKVYMDEVMDTFKKIKAVDTCNTFNFDRSDIKVEDTFNVMSKRLEYPIITNGYFYSNWYRSESLDFPTQKDFYLFLMDGYDSPSCKEFLVKVLDKERKFKGSLTRYIYSTNDLTVKGLMHYEDNEVDIITLRPFYEEILKTKTSTSSSK